MLLPRWLLPIICEDGQCSSVHSSWNSNWQMLQTSASLLLWKTFSALDLTSAKQTASVSNVIVCADTDAYGYAALLHFLLNLFMFPLGVGNVVFHCILELFIFHIHQSQRYSSFRRHLKTYYFLSAHLAPLAAPIMRRDSLSRLWRYINLLLTCLLLGAIVELCCI